MKLPKPLILFTLTAFSAFSEDIAKQTPLTDAEKVVFLKSSVVYLQSNLEALRALLNDKLGVALQQQAQQASDTHNKLLEKYRKEHNCPDCNISLDGDWIEAGK